MEKVTLDSYEKFQKPKKLNRKLKHLRREIIKDLQDEYEEGKEKKNPKDKKLMLRCKKSEGNERLIMDKKELMVAGCNSLKEIEAYLVRPSAIESY